MNRGYVETHPIFFPLLTIWEVGDSSIPDCRALEIVWTGDKPCTPPHVRSNGSAGDWCGATQSHPGRGVDVPVSQQLERQGVGTEPACSGQRKRPHAVNRTPVCTDSKRYLEMVCDQEPAKPPG